ncbi:hypothetical protein E2320_020670, partial [Naja naja]
MAQQSCHENHNSRNTEESIKSSIIIDGFDELRLSFDEPEALIAGRRSQTSNINIRDSKAEHYCVNYVSLMCWIICIEATNGKRGCCCFAAFYYVLEGREMCTGKDTHNVKTTFLNSFLSSRLRISALNHVGKMDGYFAPQMDTVIHAHYLQYCCSLKSLKLNGITFKLE